MAIKTLKKLQFKVLRAQGKLKKSQGPGRPRKVRPPPKYRPITKRRFMKALQGTGGIKQLIAGNLQCTYQAVKNCLERPGWEDVRQAWQDELDAVADDSEQTLRFLVKQRTDYGTALGASKFLLTRPRYKDRGMCDESKVVHEGGDKPIQIQDGHIPLEALDLPIEVRRQILEALDKQSEEQSK